METKLNFNVNIGLGVIFFLIIIVAAGALFFSQQKENLAGRQFRKSGEVSFPDLAKYSGCALPSDSDISANKYDAFAKCLTGKGVKMYGAYWCSHCQNQKKAFGDSFKYVNYIECANPDVKGQLSVCEKAGITGYPTWEFPQAI